MFTFVIGLVVVGVALAFATRVALRSEPAVPKPATADTGRVGAVEDYTPPTGWTRFRSGVVLFAILATLGAIVAIMLVVAGAIVLSGLRTAVQ